MQVKQGFLQAKKPANDRFANSVFDKNSVKVVRNIIFWVKLQSQQIFLFQYINSKYMTNFYA